MSFLNIRFLVLFMACAYTALAVNYKIKADFQERTDDRPDSYINGTFYYLYNSTGLSYSRFRFDYDLPGQTVVNMYNYEFSALYSICGSTCTADTLSNSPDTLWKSNNFTKSNVQDPSTGLYWYTHVTPAVGVKAQISSILVSDHASPTDAGFQLKFIKFADGRNVEIIGDVEVTTVTQREALFKIDSEKSCPTPTCAMYADIVFVLDNSKSVDNNEWSQTADFVKKIINMFKFADDLAHPSVTAGAAGAVVRFSASANMIVPAEQTVTTSSQQLIDAMNGKRTAISGTCQGSGLEIAKNVFANSPRNFSNGVRPSRIIIAVTDGEDNCKDRTQKAADSLRKEYDAFFIGVGVGLRKSSAETFIKGLTSKLVDGSPAYFGVDDYSQIKSVADQLFSPICDTIDTTACGKGCRGFCGCGRCMCPTCDLKNNGCFDFSCSVKDGETHGCVIEPVKICPDKEGESNTSCTKHYCKNDNGQGTCEEWHKCDWLKEYNPGACRTVVCNESEDGKCSINSNHKYCSKYNTNCEIWECAGENETEGVNSDGCKLKTNKTADCIKNGKGGCYETTCDINDPDGKCIEKDTCIGRWDTKCFDSVCEKNTTTNVYECKNYTTTHPADTPCKNYTCNDKTGWYISYNETASTCREKAKTKTCRTFKCVEEGEHTGCVETFIEDCTAECDSKMAECIQEATERSSIQQCHVGFCKVRKNGNIDETYCLSNHTDCRESQAAEQARALNTAEPVEGQKRVCFTLTCEFGECGIVQVPMPEEDNACYEHICVEDGEGGWKWIIRETETYKNCKSDKCHTRSCMNSTGCVPVDICVSKTTECETWTCVKDEKGVGIDCTRKEELITEECRYEMCNKSIGKKYWVYKDVVDACQYGGEDHKDRCMLPICNANGKCEYYKKAQPDDDPCKIYTCVPETGEYTYVPKCDDGLYCTENKCTVDGECRYIPINCYNLVNMTDYPCFKAECVEQATNYRCMRKLKAGVYIDVCGNCVRNGATDESSESSMEMTSCTTAPDEPLNKEGLAAASIAMIVLGAIIIGGVVATSGVVGTKALLERAHAAEGASAHTNPLFEDESAEMTNPAFAGEQ